MSHSLEWRGRELARCQSLLFLHSLQCENESGVNHSQVLHSLEWSGRVMSQKCYTPSPLSPVLIYEWLLSVSSWCLCLRYVYHRDTSVLTTYVDTMLHMCFVNLHSFLTLSGLIYHCYLHPLQASNCCRNSRFIVDEDD